MAAAGGRGREELEEGESVRVFRVSEGVSVVEILSEPAEVRE